MAGAEGVLTGNMIGGVAFGCLSVVLGYRVIRSPSRLIDRYSD